MRHRPTTAVFAVAVASILGTAFAQEQAAPPNPPPTADGQAPGQKPGQTPGQTKEIKDKDGFIVRNIRRALSDPEPGKDDPHWGPFYASAASPSSGSGFGPKLRFWAPGIGGSPVDFHASAIVTFYKYQYYDMQLGLLPHRGRQKPSFTTGSDSLYPLSDLQKTVGMQRFDLYASLRHRRYPREIFYGLGPGAPAVNRSDYALRDTLFEIVSDLRLASWLTVSARGGLLRASLNPGEDTLEPDTQVLYTDVSAPGLRRQPDYFTASAGFLVDTRDEPENPHGGGTLAVAVTRYAEKGGQEFRFNRLSVDARRFVALGSNRHVVALRALTSLDRPDAGSREPFYLQSSLGGGNILRGFRGFRFRDAKLLAFQGEYRFELVPKVELAAFYDAGEVFGETKDFDLRGLETNWGVGVRLKTIKKVRLRLDVARSHEGIRLHVKFSPAF